MKSRTFAIAILLTGLVGLASAVQASLIWTQDFSNVSNWQVIADPGGGSSVTSDGSQGLFYVNAGGNLAAFGPKTDGSSALVPFNPADKSNYYMAFTVNNLTWSTSYEFAFDEFDANTNYVNTVWQVFPSSSTTTFVGTTNVWLGAFSYDGSAAYILPKLTVHTGDGGQTIYFGAMEFSLVPEPSTMMLVAAGAAALVGFGRRRA